MCALARCGVAAAAARAAGIGVRNAYKRRLDNPTFAAAWEAAVAAQRSEAGRRSLGSALAEGLGTMPGKDGGAKRVRAGQSRWTERWQEAFLAELTACANVRLAAAAIGFTPQSAYQRRLKDARFAAAWDAAIDSGRARIQAYLVEAAARTFDPADLPVADDRELPKVSVGEAINIAKLLGAARAAALKEQGAGPASGEEPPSDELNEVAEEILRKLEALRKREFGDAAGEGAAERPNEG